MYRKDALRAARSIAARFVRPILARVRPPVTGEESTIPLVLALTRDARAFVDVGANHGVFALQARRRDPTLRVVAYEPTPRLAAEMRAHGAGIEVIESAVGREVGEATFYVSASDLESTLVPERAAKLPDVSAIRVPVVALDDEFRRLGLDDLMREGAAAALVAKIDVEGAEEAVWAGMPTVLASPAEIVIEFLGRAIQTGAIERALSTGRTVYYLPPAGPVRVRSVGDFLRTQDERAWNFWLTPRTPEEAERFLRRIGLAVSNG